MRAFNTLTIALFPIAIALNILLGQLPVWLRLPIYLDSVGTVLVGVLAGPLAGALVGALSYLVANFLFGGTWLYFIPAAMAAGVLAGLFGARSWLRKPFRALFAGLITGAITALVGGAIQGTLLGGASGAGTDALTAILLRYTNGNEVLASLGQSLIVDPLDKALTFLLVFALVKSMSRRLLVRFPQGEKSAPPHRRPLIGRVD